MWAARRLLRVSRGRIPSSRVLRTTFAFKQQSRPFSLWSDFKEKLGDMMDRDKDLKKAMKDIGFDKDEKDSEKDGEQKPTFFSELEKKMSNAQKSVSSTWSKVSNRISNKSGTLALAIAGRISKTRKLAPVYDELDEYAEDMIDDEEVGFKEVTHLPRNDILETIVEAGLDLDEHEIRRLIDLADKDGNTLNYIMALNMIHVHMINKFGQETTEACLAADSKGSGALAGDEMLKIFNEHLSTNITAAELLQLQEVYGHESEEGIEYMGLISNIVSESIAAIPSPSSESQNSVLSMVSRYTESLGDSMEDKFMASSEAALKNSAEWSVEKMDKMGLSSMRQMLMSEAKYLDEYAEKLMGSSIEEREKRMEKKNRMMSGKFDRDAYMARMREINPEKEDEEANDDENLEAKDSTNNSSSSDEKVEASSEVDETEQKELNEDGDVKDSSAMEYEDEEDAYTGTTALMTQEERKTIWEKRMERWGQKMQNWKVFREVRKAKRQLETSDNKAIAKTREKIKDAQDAIDDAKEVWESSQHPLIWKARDVSEFIFGENEQGYVKGELLRLDAGFNEEELLDELRTFMIPIVVEAFMRGDLEFLRTISVGTAEAALHQSITQRKTLGHVYDSRVLRMNHLDIQKFQLRDGVPEVQVMFVCQHQHCVRNFAGDVVEGQEGGMQNVQYVWTLQRTLDNPDFDWIISEFHMAFTQLVQ